jgi:hypothetical protein
MPRTKLQEIRLPALKGVVRFARLLSQRTSNTTYHEQRSVRTGREECEWEKAPLITIILPLMPWYQQIVGDNAIAI